VVLYQALGTPEYSKSMPYHRITAQRASKVLSSYKLEEQQRCFVPL